MRIYKEKKETIDEDVNINIKESWEMEWWPWRLGVTRQELVEAVRSVGPRLNKVKRFLFSRRKKS